MPDPDDHEARIAALEARMQDVAADATAARHLSAANDRDLSDLGVKVDANRVAINALGVQTAGRFESLENEVRTGFAEMRVKFDQVDDGFAEMRAKFDQVDDGFAEMRAKFDQAAAGHQQIVDLITTLIERDAG